MTGRSFAVSVATVAIVAAIAWRWFTPSPAGLPAPVHAAVARHAVQSIEDTAAVNRLEREKAAAVRRELAAARARKLAEDSAAAAGRRADSLEAVARSVQTAADSAAAWRAAYEARTEEADQLRVAVDSAKAETGQVRLQLAAAEAQAGTWKAHALRGDTMIAQLLPLAETAGDRCRLLRVISCPTRKQTAIAAVVGTIAALGAARH